MYIFTIYPLPYEVSVVGVFFWLGLLHHKNLDMQSRIESMFRFFVFFFFGSWKVANAGSEMKSICLFV